MQTNRQALIADEPFYRLPEPAYHALHDLCGFIELLAALCRARGPLDGALDYRLALPPDTLAHCLSLIARELAMPLAALEWSARPSG